MTIQLMATMTRPSIDIPWHSFDNGRGWYMNDAYYLLNWHDSNKLISTTFSASEDGLTATYVREFSDWQAMDDFISDQNLQAIRSLITTYYKTMGIEIINLETKDMSDISNQKISLKTSKFADN